MLCYISHGFDWNFFMILGVQYVQAFATGVDWSKKEISCIDLYEHMDYKKASAGGNTEETKTRTNFKIPYDKVI